MKDLFVKNLFGDDIYVSKNKKSEVDFYEDYFDGKIVHEKVIGWYTFIDIITGDECRIPVDKNHLLFIKCDGEYYHYDEVPYWLLDGEGNIIS